MLTRYFCELQNIQTFKVIGNVFLSSENDKASEIEILKSY
jgi:hypothetical protein